MPVVVDLCDSSDDEEEPRTKRQCYNTAALAQLTDMGYPEARARLALAANNDELDGALNTLLGPPASHDAGHNSHDASEALARRLHAEEAAAASGVPDDAALARRLHEEETAAAAVSRQGDDAALARKLQAEEEAAWPAARPAAGSSSDGSGLHRCWYGTACRHRADPDHARRYRHDQPPLDQREMHMHKRRAAEACALAARDAELASGVVPPLVRMRGEVLMMNALRSSRPAEGAAATPLGVPLPREITNADLHWHAPFLTRALLASYGVDYAYVRRMVMRGSPAARTDGGVIIVDNYEHDTQLPGFDARSHAPAVVVMPPFFDAGPPRLSNCHEVHCAPCHACDGGCRPGEPRAACARGEGHDAPQAAAARVRRRHT